MSPELAAAIATTLTVLAAWLRQELDARQRRRGEKRTRKSDRPRGPWV